MSQPAPSDDRQLLLQAALDDELDAAGMLAFERALHEDADLAAEYARLEALRTSFRGLGKVAASPALRSRVAALAETQPPLPRRAPPISGWRPAAIAACLALLIGSGLTMLTFPHATPEPARLLVASHVRGLISGQLTDVLSSDRHTIKPWFATRSVVSPHVVDLAADGFQLVGGRLDVIGVTPVPTLVFRHGAHIISLTDLPDKLAHLSPGRSTLDGYAVLVWRQGDATYVAISDAQPAELDALAAAYRKATASP